MQTNREDIRPIICHCNLYTVYKAFSQTDNKNKTSILLITKYIFDINNCVTVSLAKIKACKFKKWHLRENLKITFMNQSL